MKNNILIFVIAATVILLAACGFGIAILVPWSSLISSTQAASAGPVQTETREVSSFTAVDFRSVGELTITQGDTESLTIQAEEKILRQIKTEVSNGTLTIRVQPESTTSMNTKQGIYYTLTVKRLDALTLAGAGNAHATNIKSDRLAVTLTGVGNLDISGEASQQNVLLSGVGNYQAGSLKSRTAQVQVTGLGSATVWATDTLDATITSAGSISYYGSPQLDKNIKGLGSVTGLGSK